MRQAEVDSSEDSSLDAGISNTVTPGGVERPNDSDPLSGPAGDTGLASGGDSIPSAFLREVARAPAAKPAKDLCGKTLGRYRVRDKLGRGAMGIVYDAQDLVLRRSVALKVLPDHLVRDPERRRRFLREAQSAALAAHPHIAAVYDVQEDGDHVFIAMERVEGRTLREVISSARRDGKGGLPRAEVVSFGRQIASGLEKAHEAGVVHRDLKPENIMVGPGGHVKILDFGIAKLCFDAPGDTEPFLITGEGQLLGTPSYMAPEQAHGLSIDGRADIFSLGVVLYELATGVRPFPGTTVAEVLASIEGSAPQPPVKRNPDIGAELSAVIERCLQREPAERYPHCRELGDALKEVEALPGPSSLPSGRQTMATAPAAAASIDAAPPAPPAPPARRRWAVRALAAGSALLAAGAAVIALKREPPPPPPAPAPVVASPLAAPGAALACPPLEADGVEAPSGWLGAAASSLVCRRARALMGGAASHVLVPAALLDLPRQPHDDFPRDPFGDPAARPKAVAAAQARAAAYLDGRVTKESNGFRVTLTLKDPAGQEHGRGEGRGVSLHQAVMAGMAPLIESKAIPRAAATDPDEAAWSGVADAGLLLDLEDWLLAFEEGAGRRPIEARLERRKAELGPQWGSLMSMVASRVGEGWDAIAIPDIDRSSAPAFARTALLRARLDPKADAAALAEEARAFAAAQATPTGKTALALAEAQLRARAGDSTRAGALALSAVSQDPCAAASTLAELSIGRPGQTSAARAFAAWVPESPDGWNMLFLGRDSKEDSEIGPKMIRRAHALSPGLPLYAVHESMYHIHQGHRERARAIAAELVSVGAALGGEEVPDPRLVAGEYVLAEVEANEGRLGAAMARARRVLFEQKRFGRLDTTDIYILALLLDLSVLLGGASETAEQFVQVFVDPEPPRLAAGANVPYRVAGACARAPRVTARRCFSRLRSLIESGYFREDLVPMTMPFLDGAEAYSQGDYARAAEAWRPLSERPGTNGVNLIPDAFDRAGMVDLADRMDSRHVDGGPFNGIGLAALRSARRALAAGDRPRAEKLAKRIVDAWSSADVPVPAVDEMLGLLGKRKRASRL